MVAGKVGSRLKLIGEILLWNFQRFHHNMGRLGNGQNRSEFTSLVGERLCLKRKPSVSASGEEVDCFNTSLVLVCCFGCFCCLLPLDASPLYNHIIQ